MIYPMWPLLAINIGFQGNNNSPKVNPLRGILQVSGKYLNQVRCNGRAPPNREEKCQPSYKSHRPPYLNLSILNSNLTYKESLQSASPLSCRLVQGMLLSRVHQTFKRDLQFGPRLRLPKISLLNTKARQLKPHRNHPLTNRLKRSHLPPHPLPSQASNHLPLRSQARKIKMRRKSTLTTTMRNTMMSKAKMTTMEKNTERKMRTKHTLMKTMKMFQHCQLPQLSGRRAPHQRS